MHFLGNQKNNDFQHKLNSNMTGSYKGRVKVIKKKKKKEKKEKKKRKKTTY